MSEKELVRCGCTVIELYLYYLFISNSKVNNFDTETGQCFPEREGSDKTQTGGGITGLISMVDLA